VLLSRGDNMGTTFGGHLPLKIWEGRKPPKLGTISDNFRLWSRISLEHKEISNTGKERYQLQSLSRWTKISLVNFGALMPEITWWMFSYPWLTVCILPMLMHLTLGHVTLLAGEFQPRNFSTNRIYSAGRTHVGLCPKFLVLGLFIFETLFWH